MPKSFIALKPFIAALVIPTGIGASVGGFAGDATPVMNLLASVSDILITHPNVANAAVFQKLPENALYVEGYGLDQFFKGQWRLRPVRQNRVGVVMDSGMDPAMAVLHRNTINAVRSVYGVEITDIVTTSIPIDMTYGLAPSGCSTGELRNPHILLEACETLLRQGATAIALCIHFPDLLLEDAKSGPKQAPKQINNAEAAYRQAGGVDPVGGVEAILSHLVVSQFGVPCANSPVFPLETASPVLDEVVAPRAAAEYITPTFLPCVLTGLARAPRFTASADNNPNVGPTRSLALTNTETPAFLESARNQHTIGIADLDVLVVPADALGGVPVLSALSRNIPVIAVQENRTVCTVDSQTLAHSHLTVVQSYLEAVGLCAALKAGIAWDSLRCGMVDFPVHAPALPKR